MRAEVDVRPARDRRRARSRWAFLRAVRWRLVGSWGAVALLLAALVAGIVFAGSSNRIAAGVRVAGVSVAGLTPDEAAARLEQHAARVASVPVAFTAGSSRFPLRPSDLEARVDWNAVAAEARARGDWPLPFRGLKRVAVRLVGVEVEPVADVFEPRLEREIGRMAAKLDRPGRNAAVVLNGLEPSLIPDTEGRTLNRRETADLIVRSLAAFDRTPVALPVRVGPPEVTAGDLEPVLGQVRTALSGPVRLGWKDAHWLVQPAQLANLLQLPGDGRRDLRIAGPGAERYFKLLSRAVDRRAKEATFAVGESGAVRVVPSATGRKLEVEASAEALLAGALAPERREAELVIRTIEPELATDRAKAMGIRQRLAAYTTLYSGTPDRIRNLQIAAGLVDGTALEPGEEFSFNEVVGPRTVKRGFRPAPTIIENEYKDEVGGGVSQVATTIFNAAWEAGLRISVRTAHSLYIDRYPIGRDATVNYPDVDFRFVNDTAGWLVVRAQEGDSGITVSLLGSPTDRRVVSEEGELEETGPPQVESVPDPTLFVGQTAVVDEGEPSREVLVRRTVYEGDRVLYEETWRTQYASEPQIVRMGTIPVAPEPPPSPPPAPPPARPGKPPAADSTTPTTTGAAPTTTGTP